MEEYVVVGAGLSGMTIARKLAENGHKVSVLDRRKNIGGNAYDEIDKNGILIQPYGPHIFHTNEKEVFEFLSNFTEWTKYEHRVKANIRGKLVPVPFNLTSLFKLYSQESAKQIKEVLVEEIGYGKKVPILKLKEHPNRKIRNFADFVYKNIFYTYTKKQWGFEPEQLGETVMNRVPVYISDEDRYFTDEYQYMPKHGFTKMLESMANHPNIKVYCSVDSRQVLSLRNGEIFVNNKKYDGKVIYTGCLDELFNYQFGILSYRSLKFKFATKRAVSFQQSAVVNYTTSKRYTRITEFTKFTCEPKDKTVIVKEYARPFVRNKNIPYYPIPNEENFKHYELYKEQAEKYKNLYLLGRLANYKYINMDIAVKNALDLFEKLGGDKCHK